MDGTIQIWIINISHCGPYNPYISQLAETGGHIDRTWVNIPEVLNLTVQALKMLAENLEICLNWIIESYSISMIS